MTNTDRKFRDRRVVPQPVRLTRGAYDGRYEVEFDGRHVGWVIKQPTYAAEHAGMWLAVVQVPDEYRGITIDVSDTRVNAVFSVLYAAMNRYARLDRAEYDAALDDSWYLP